MNLNLLNDENYGFKRFIFEETHIDGLLLLLKKPIGDSWIP